MTKQEIKNILTGDYAQDIKLLPKYQKKEIKKAIQIYRQLEYYKFAVITFTELKKELRLIIRAGG